MAGGGSGGLTSAVGMPGMGQGQSAGQQPASPKPDPMDLLDAGF